jgi:hypothetical protein
MIDADDAMIGVGFSERPPVIDDVIVVGIGNVDDGVMAAIWIAWRMNS